MRILVVSLLRLGDLLMAAPVLSQLKRQYPNAKIDVLINPQARAAIELMDSINVAHVFERDLLQEGLLDAQRPIMESFFRVDRLVHRLNGLNYDLLINLTHNRLSGWLCGAIEATEKMGLWFDGKSKAQFHSAWFKYLNDNADIRGVDTFHFVDVFRFGVGLTAQGAKISWRKSESSETEAQKCLHGLGEFVALQPFTSETKKEWPASAWVKFVQQMKNKTSSVDFLLLAAPQEASRAQDLHRQMMDAGIEVRVAICSLQSVPAILNQAKILITGDTSIKHIAAGAACEVVELSLGSSDWKRTGIYKEGAYILQPKTECAPCSHSSLCDKPQHLCALQLPADLVAEVTGAIFNNAKSEIAAIGARFPQVDIRKTTFSGSGYWQTVEIGRNLELRDVREWLGRLTTKMILQGEHFKVIGEFGSEASRLGHWMRNQFPQVGQDKWRGLLDEAASQVGEEFGRAEDAKERFLKLMKESHKMNMVNISEMRQLQEKVSEVGHRLDIHQKLVRSLRYSIEEAI